LGGENSLSSVGIIGMLLQFGHFQDMAIVILEVIGIRVKILGITSSFL
jgi:hypothetical protein